MSYLFAAYSAIWFIVFFYAFTVSKRQRSIEKELLYIKSIIDSKGSVPTDL
ncbi:CcmD family protein [Desulfitobacterium hafniense]|uniref:CcmD family protein n=1 Tax=Desulfitobacterium hafniense TaxID=49338 RepID=UPI0009C1577D|nr:CcmD family protein [Desulfitobacterium hafniense]